VQAGFFLASRAGAGNVALAFSCVWFRANAKKIPNSNEDFP
jgi:hypothetical protein